MILKVQEKTTLLPFLLNHPHGFKRNTLKDWLRFEKIRVNDEIIKRHDHPLEPGDLISLGASDSSRSPIKIIFEDAHLLVVEKPAGMLTIATDRVKTGTVYYEVTDHVKRTSPSRKKNLFIVHRLDKEVSGLLVFAKSFEVKTELQINWKKAQKKYAAVVEGQPKQTEGTIGSYLHENKFLKVYSGPKSEDAKHSVTHYRVVQSNEKHSLMEIVLETGRKHQIRVHMSDLGCPIVGDEKYGAKEKSRQLALHAIELSFDHPLTGKRMTFKSSMPSFYSKLLGTSLR